MATPREKFQALLKKLFQFDCAELDFGIYRIMNQKRAVIERFIEKDLLDGVAMELSSGSLAHESALTQQLAEVAAQIKENFGEEALDAEGNLAADYQKTPRGKQYLELQARAGKAKSRPELEADIFNHLHAFFSRYYDEGDFMSLRRYSKRDKYAIPYNGEEVHLHWANADQYYIKTGENFTDYSYTHGGWTVHFKLRNADVEQNNVKGAKRFFVVRTADIAVDEVEKTLAIPLAYRPLNVDEELRYGAKKKADNGKSESKPADDAAGKRKKGQEGIMLDAIAAIQTSVKKYPEALAALLHEKRKDADGNPASLLEHHLRTYVRGNSNDFFIHKDLKGFLERELDFYLKNEVLNLDELESGGEARSESWFQTLRAIKSIGRKIIAFVSQIENFQKRLFEKKKFITEVNYCITLDRVPEAMYPEIAKNKSQIAEWKTLFQIQEIEGDLGMPGFTEPLKVDFLKANKTLLLDTRFFSAEFKDRLLTSVKGLDANCNGVLVRSDNFQALRLLEDRYREQVKCEYIDPPYNTSTSSIPYKNDYKHSSWGTLMRDRLQVMARMLREDGAIFVSIDKNERTILEFALDSVFKRENKVEELIWVQNTNDGKSPTYSTNHEYVEVYSRSKQAVENDPQMFREPKPGYEEVMDLVETLNPSYPPISKIIKALDELYKLHQREYREAVEAEELDYEEEKRNDPWKGLFNYCLAEYRDDNGKYVPEGQAKTKKAKIWVYRESDWTIMSSETKQSPTIKDPSHPNYRYYDIPHPNGKPCKPSSRGWKGTRLVDAEHPERTSCESLLADNRVSFGLDENKVPQQKRFLHEVETNVCKSVFVDYSDGEKELAAMFNKTGLFLAPKHSRFVARLIQQGAAKDSLILDCFGGSGSTAHGVISLNRKDEGKRKYVLVEMGHHFDTLLKPRVCKAIYSPTWRQGRPTGRTSGLSHCIKYFRLESYEDALDNISFQPTEEQSMFQLEDYVLNYLLNFETKQSETLLSVAKLDAPFDYKLRTQGRDEPMPVDLPETFNYLIGLHVESRTVYDNKGVRYVIYRGKADDRETAVIWRTTRGWKKEQFEADLDFIAKQKLTEGAEDVLVNTDSFIPSARSLDPIFKRRMFNED